MNSLVIDGVTSVVMVILSLAYILLRRDDPISGEKNLSLSTKVFSPIKGLDSRHVVSVSELMMTSNPLVTHVFRYTFKADYHQVVSKFQRSLPKSAGWHTSTSSKVSTDFWRVSPTKKLKLQGLIIQATRLVRDKKSPNGWSPLPPAKGKGWVWISYNEQFLNSSK